MTRQTEYRPEGPEFTPHPGPRPQHSWYSELERPIKKNYEVGEEFTIEDIYDYEEYLQKTFPTAKHVRPAIRDTLQRLRDDGVIIFLGERGTPQAGRYRRVS